MGGRAGGGARSGMGGGGSARAQFYTFNTRYGSVTINKKKTPQQVLAQANRLEKALKAKVQGQAAGATSLVDAVRVAKPKVESFRKVKAAQLMGKLGKGTKV